MSNKLPKHIAQMVEKNNLVMAIKTLTEEKNISMAEAKEIIDDYEEALKQKQTDKVKSIASKQNSNIDSDSKFAASTQKLNASLDSHLKDLGYKKPLIPYWVKRVLVFITVLMILGFTLWWIMT